VGRTAGRADSARPTREGFTGKERDAETGLDYFGFRYYMPAPGRWTTTDPLADNFSSWSPYNYVLNSPTGNIDPDGAVVIGLVSGFSEACSVAA
jgi:RHS repeat-associated protein